MEEHALLSCIGFAGLMPLILMGLPEGPLGSIHGMPSLHCNALEAPSLLGQRHVAKDGAAPLVTTGEQLQERELAIHLQVETCLRSV